MTTSKRYFENFKIGDLVMNTSDYDLGFNDLYTILKPKEMAIVVGIRENHERWIQLYSESGTLGWYLSHTGYLMLISKGKNT